MIRRKDRPRATQYDGPVYTLGSCQRESNGDELSHDDRGEWRVRTRRQALADTGSCRWLVECRDDRRYRGRAKSDLDKLACRQRRLHAFCTGVRVARRRDVKPLAKALLTVIGPHQLVHVDC